MTKNLKISSLEELLKTNITQPQMIAEPIISQGGLVGLYAPRGVGKTFVSMEIAYCVAMGLDIFGGKWKVIEAHKVLFIDGEMPLWALMKRFRKIHDRHQGKHETNLQIFNNEEQSITVAMDIMEEEYRNAIDANLDGVSLLILDNLSSLCYGKENDSTSWGVVQQWLLSIRKRGISILIVHHAGKNGKQRGTSRMEDTLDTLIKLDKQGKASDGCYFIVKYEKNRHFFGVDANPFAVRLNNNRNQWEISQTEESIVNDEKQREEAEKDLKIIEIRNDNKTFDEIAKTLKVGKDRISKVYKAAKLSCDDVDMNKE